jgi:hypothetical protein
MSFLLESTEVQRGYIMKFLRTLGLTVEDTSIVIRDGLVQVKSKENAILLNKLGKYITYTVLDSKTGLYCSIFKLTNTEGLTNSTCKRYKLYIPNGDPIYIPIPTICYNREDYHPITLVSGKAMVSTMTDSLRNIFLPFNPEVEEQCRHLDEITKGYISLCRTIQRDLVDRVVITDTTKPSNIVVYIYNESQALWFKCQNASLYQLLKSTIIAHIDIHIEETDKNQFSLRQSYRGNRPMTFDNLSKALFALRKIAGDPSKLDKIIKVLSAHITNGGLYNPDFTKLLDKSFPELLPTRGRNLVFSNTNLDYYNGEVTCLRTGTVSPRTAKHYFSRTTNVRLPDRSEEELLSLSNQGYISNAIYNFYREVSNCDEEVRLELQKFLGYCLSGDMTGRIFGIWYGTDHNGKSACTKILQSVMNSLYTGASRDIFIQNKNKASTRYHTSHLRALDNARVASFSEWCQGEKLNEGTLKSISCGDMIYTRECGQSTPVTLNVKLYFETNTIPDYITEPSVVARLRCFGFLSNFVDNPTKPGEYLARPNYVDELIKNNLDEFFEYMVYGSMKFFNISEAGSKFIVPEVVRSVVPEVVRYVVHHHNVENDTVAAFVDAYYDIHPDLKADIVYDTEYFKISKAAMYNNYKSYCTDLKILPKSAKVLGLYIGSIGCNPKVGGKCHRSHYKYIRPKVNSTIEGL